jgi:hypothetical protein
MTRKRGNPTRVRRLIRALQDWRDYARFKLSQARARRENKNNDSNIYPLW